MPAMRYCVPAAFQLLQSHTVHFPPDGDDETTRSFCVIVTRSTEPRPPFVVLLESVSVSGPSSQKFNLRLHLAGGSCIRGRPNLVCQSTRCALLSQLISCVNPASIQATSLRNRLDRRPGSVPLSTRGVARFRRRETSDKFDFFLAKAFISHGDEREEKHANLTDTSVSFDRGENERIFL